MEKNKNIFEEIKNDKDALEILNRRKSFVMYYETFEQFQDLNDNQLGKVFKTMLDYSINYQTEEELSQVERIVFNSWKRNFDKDTLSYINKVKKQIQGGEIGGTRKAENQQRRLKENQEIDANSIDFILDSEDRLTKDQKEQFKEQIKDRKFTLNEIQQELENYINKSTLT